MKTTHWNNSTVFTDSSFPLAIRPDNLSLVLDYHSHEFFEIIYATRGSGRHHVFKEKETTYEVIAGDLFVVDSTTKHHFTNNGKLQIINILFQPEIIHSEMDELRTIEGLYEFLVIEPWFRSESNFHYKLRLDSANKGVIESLINQMQSELALRRYGYKSSARALFVMFLVAVGRAYSGTFNSQQESVDISGKKEAVQKALSHIEQNYSSITSLSAISDNIFLSPNYFCNLFKETTGLSPWDYLIRVRLEEAKKLLSGSNRKISDIASTVGFSSDSYFGKVFRAHTGSTPHQYRLKPAKP
jgi:AraC-like DNA-binding protein/mannose-6-phosphate isomerase-like protein (cupin superfamily)